MSEMAQFIYERQFLIVIVKLVWVMEDNLIVLSCAKGHIQQRFLTCIFFICQLHQFKYPPSSPTFG